MEIAVSLFTNIRKKNYLCDTLEEFPKYGQMNEMRMAPSENIETQFQINMTFISEDRGSCEQTLNYTLLMSD